MKKILLLSLLIIGLATVSAQPKKKKNIIKVAPTVCYASGKIERAAIPPPAEFLNSLKSASEIKSNIVVNYNNFPLVAKQAFEYAVTIWESIIESDITIYVHANWTELGDGVLGNCGPESYITDFENIPHENSYYPIALAEKLSKTEITGSNEPDISANFNSTTNWYYGTDLDTPTPDSLYNFVTVVLHEMAHGLGFTGFFFTEGPRGAYGYFDYGEEAAFDLLVEDHDGQQLVDTMVFPVPSVELKTTFTSGFLYANSIVAAHDNTGVIPRLYSPRSWDSGSSIYHLNDATYPSTNPNSLMTHAIGKAEAVHNPGPITSGILADIGWKHLYMDFEELRDNETNQTLAFDVNIESDYELDTASLFVIYSIDSFQTHVDSIPLISKQTPTLFSAELLPEHDTCEIHYYINAGDIKTRTFTLPKKAPETLYSINIGPDKELPTIQHDSIPFYFVTDEDLKISANVDDNIGIDTVIVEYSINGIEQIPFGLKNDSLINYSGIFIFNKDQLNDGDIVAYNLKAIDNSTANNIKIEPSENRYSIKIERFLNPIIQYLNAFDSSTTDFIISDFDIYSDSEFSNGALHSPHPYPSPNENNTEFNFITILKQPIVLQSRASMNFDEVVLVEPGVDLSEFGDDDFWDYAIVEGSRDSGKTWLPLNDGYDSRDDDIWLENFMENIDDDQLSTAIGKSDWFVNREINLLKTGNFSVGDTIIIRFRLFSDPFANGWGWVIDNLRIQVPVSSPETKLSANKINLYPNPFTNELNLRLELNNNAEEIQIEFYNMYGQKVKSLQFNNIIGRVTEKIEINDLPEGLYLVSISENGQQLSTKKIVKKSN